MDTDHARELLAARRAQIERALGDALRRDEDPDSVETSDAGSELFDAELSEGIVARMREELDAIERAEQRLAQGTYGVSVESGQPIPDARLETIPWAERTADEQARYERQGGSGPAA
jgi:DnaK suppressor protein